MVPQGLKKNVGEKYFKNLKKVFGSEATKMNQMVRVY